MFDVSYVNFDEILRFYEARCSDDKTSTTDDEYVKNAHFSCKVLNRVK